MIITQNKTDLLAANWYPVQSAISCTLPLCEVYQIGPKTSDLFSLIACYKVHTTYLYSPDSFTQFSL